MNTSGLDFEELFPYVEEHALYHVISEYILGTESALL